MSPWPICLAALAAFGMVLAVLFLAFPNVH